MKPTQQRGREGVDVSRSDLDKLPTDCTNNRGIKDSRQDPQTGFPAHMDVSVCVKGNTNMKIE